VSLSSLAKECWATVDTAEAELVVVGDFAVQADRSRLQQAIENLFANAVTHGGPNVRVEVGTIDGPAGDVGFYVADDGPGIPDEMRGQAFDAGASTDSDGTGFGLKIVERVAAAHGWSVEVVDAADGGARFEFRGVESADPAAVGDD
jgi:signal transduction histidine kinase